VCGFGVRYLSFFVRICINKTLSAIERGQKFGLKILFAATRVTVQFRSGAQRKKATSVAFFGL
jgi:hypothetical protein